MRENVDALRRRARLSATRRWRRRIDEVIAFAGLERFRDAKLKNLSSGMLVRLAFATALRADADILLLDEVLAVGDAQFQRKCFDVFAGSSAQRKTIVLVSHDLGSVQRFCDHVYWLDKGRLVMSGDGRRGGPDLPRRVRADARRAASASPLDERRGRTEHRWGDGGCASPTCTLDGRRGPAAHAR